MQTKKLAYWGGGAIAAAALIAIAWWQLSPRGSAKVQSAETAAAIIPAAPRPVTPTPTVAAGTNTEAAVQSAQPSFCGGDTRCAEVSTFVANAVDLRESIVTGTFPGRMIGVTVRFRNNTGGQLVLAYVRGSGVVTDELGNRYTIRSNGVRGLGETGNGLIDPSFALRAGETGDTHFDFTLFPKGEALGSQYVVAMAIREIEPLLGNSNGWRLGREHVLQFSGFGHPAVAAAATVTETAKR